MSRNLANRTGRSPGAPRCDTRPKTWRGALAHGFVLSALFLCLGSSAQTTSSPRSASLAEGIQLFRSGQATEAKLAFDAVIKATPRSAEALTWRGICENQMEQYAAAAQDFRSALRVVPSMLPAHYNLALSLIRLHETDGAIEQLRLVVSAQPHAVQPLYNLAVLLEGKGSIAEAIKYLDLAHTLGPADKGVTLHLLVDSLITKQDTRVPLLVSDLAQASTSAQMQREAGTALLEAGRFPDAITLLKAAREREPAAPGVDLLLARALLGDEQNAQAVGLLESAPEASAGDERSYLLALAYLGSGDRDKAAQSFEAAARIDPKDPRPIYHLGLISAAKPDGQQEAVKQLRLASRLQASNAVYAEALARILLATDQAEEAKFVLTNLLPADKPGGQRQTLLGIALAATHDTAEAISLLTLALTADPAIALAHNVLGFCLFQQGQYPQAAAAYGRASELEPRRLLYAQDAALAFERAGQTESALRFAERANALGGQDAHDHALLGKLYASSNRLPDAIRELRRAVELDPDLDAAYYGLARASLQLGDRQQATAWSEKLAALKQRHEAEFALRKKAAAVPLRSSTLLEGGLLRDEQPEIR
jgi:tetratricopeptide (TPR) repeat protein